MLDEVIDPFSLYDYCSPGPGEHFFAGVAQLVEQLIRNQQVSGSSPLAGFLTDNKALKRITTANTFKCPLLLPLQHALPADNRLIVCRQTVQDGDASDVFRRCLLEQVVENLRRQVVRRIVIVTDGRAQLLH